MVNPPSVAGRVHGVVGAAIRVWNHAKHQGIIANYGGVAIKEPVRNRRPTDPAHIELDTESTDAGSNRLRVTLLDERIGQLVGGRRLLDAAAERKTSVRGGACRPKVIVLVVLAPLTAMAILAVLPEHERPQRGSTSAFGGRAVIQDKSRVG